MHKKKRKSMIKEKEDSYYLICERNWVFFCLIAVAGFWGSYTYSLRGNVFCNAQTGNIVLMGLALGNGNWKTALYYLVPLSAYIFGSFVSELVPNPVKRKFYVRWDTILIGIEIFAVFLLGLIPDSAPVQISQIAINFIASMQYNTFRQAEGVPMATTFATNHIRQIGVGLAKEFHHRHSKNKKHRVKLIKHSKMLFFFTAGAVLGTVCCNVFGGKAIWVTLIPLGFLLVRFLHADLILEKTLKHKKPAGH